MALALLAAAGCNADEDPSGDGDQAGSGGSSAGQGGAAGATAGSGGSTTSTGGSSGSAGTSSGGSSGAAGTSTGGTSGAAGTSTGGASGGAGTGTGGASGSAGTSSAGMGGASGSGGTAGGTGECRLAKNPKEVVVVDCASEVTVANDGNGFRPAPPAGSECHGESSYELVFATRTLSWTLCEESPTAAWKKETGERELSVAELSGAMNELRTVTVWDGKMACGADKPTITIEVVTPPGKRTYMDSFYSCSMRPDTIYVDHIDAAFRALQMLAEKP